MSAKGIRLVINEVDWAVVSTMNIQVGKFICSGIGTQCCSSTVLLIRKLTNYFLPWRTDLLRISLTNFVTFFYIAMQQFVRVLFILMFAKYLAIDRPHCKVKNFCTETESHVGL